MVQNVNNKMFYFDTNIEVRLGDKITYRRLLLPWKKDSGRVVYVPGQSPKNPNMEYGDVKEWAFVLNNDPNTLLSAGYFPKEEKYVSKRIQFIGRGDAMGSISEDVEIL